MKKLIYCALALSLLPACKGDNADQAEKWSWDGFERIDSVPVISPDTTARFLCPMRGEEVAWMESDVFNPASAVKGDTLFVIFRSEDNSATGIGQRCSRLGLAWTTDGKTFNYEKTPVFYPDNDSQAELEQPGGCEDPRIVVTEDGLYVMAYTQWNRKQARLAIATSPDLRNWTKHGPAFAAAYEGRFKDDFSKSASIVTEVKNGRQVAAKIDGKYWMYWGEKFVNAATSDDLINWTPLLDENGELLHVMDVRDGHFDSDLTECGPPAVLTDKGILLIYNGKNAGDERGDKEFTANAYCGGQALFDSEEPSRLVMRLDKPFFIPEANFEKSGQYPAGTVFLEGLSLFKGKWYMFYGCADSRVGAAVRKP